MWQRRVLTWPRPGNFIALQCKRTALRITLETYVCTEVEGTWTKGNSKNVQKLGIALLLTIPILNENNTWINKSRDWHIDDVANKSSVWFFMIPTFKRYLSKFHDILMFGPRVTVI